MASRRVVLKTLMSLCNTHLREGKKAFKKALHDNIKALLLCVCKWDPHPMYVCACMCMNMLLQPYLTAPHASSLASRSCASLFPCMEGGSCTEAVPWVRCKLSCCVASCDVEAAMLQAAQPTTHHTPITHICSTSTGNESSRICEVQPKTLTMSPYVRIFLNDGDKCEDYYCKGNFLAKKFEIYQKVPGTDKLLAQVKKESSYANAASYINNKMFNAQSYFITIKPGVDAAFVVAIAALMDEIYRDNTA